MFSEIGVGVGTNDYDKSVQISTVSIRGTQLNKLQASKELINLSVKEYPFIKQGKSKEFLIQQMLSKSISGSDVMNPALADASSSAWEFSPTFNSSALLVNPR